VALKAGSLVSVANGEVLLERLQSGGPGTLNIPKEKIYELGNYESVATVRDTPELTFSLESYDVSLDTEQALVDATTADMLQNGIDLAKSKPLNVAQNWKPGKKLADPFRAVAGVGLPYLTIESASYRFGVRDNATQTFSLKSDSIYFCGSPVYIDRYQGSGVAGQTCVTTHPGLPYTDANGTRRILAVTAGLNRLTEGPDYTVAYGTLSDNAAIATVTITQAVPATESIHITYHSPDPIDYPQTVHTPATLKPAAVKGRDIDIYVGGYDPDDPVSSAANKLTGIQDITIEWRVTQEEEREMGNPNAVSRDFDVPTVSGTVTFQPRNVSDLMAKLRKITGVVDQDAAIGPDVAALLPLDVVIKDAESGGATLKRFSIPDARFSVPGYNPRVEQNVSLSLEWESDTGAMTIYRDLGGPVVTGLSAATGEEDDEITISGVNFIGVTGVKFGATAAADFTVDNHRQITVTVPAGTGSVDVAVTTAIGTSEANDDTEFTYA